MRIKYSICSTLAEECVIIIIQTHDKSEIYIASISGNIVAMNDPQLKSFRLSAKRKFSREASKAGTGPSIEGTAATYITPNEILM